MVFVEAFVREAFEPFDPRLDVGVVVLVLLLVLLVAILTVVASGKCKILVLNKYPQILIRLHFILGIRILKFDTRGT